MQVYGYVRVNTEEQARGGVRLAAQQVKLDQLTRMQVQGLSMQKIADRLNADGVPSLTGRGKWQRGTIGNLLAEAKEGAAHDRTHV